MTDEGALARYATRLDPRVLADIRTWVDHPTLGPLYTRLDASTRKRGFLDTFAEALVARRLVNRGCAVEFEVPTPGGRAVDFAVSRGGVEFFLHVKRLDTAPRGGGRTLTISSRLRSLERIERPYVVSVRWHDRASDADMTRLVQSATDFILQARVGDELVVNGDDGKEIGGVLILAPWEGPSVSLVIGLPSGFIDEAPRIRRLLRRAYRQFMPRAVNVILACSGRTDDYEDFERALLGSHEERWDAFPPRGRRIAHGRAADGLWHEKRYDDSRVAGWFRLTESEPGLAVRLLFREGTTVEPEVEATLADVLG